MDGAPLDRITRLLRDESVLSGRQRDHGKTALSDEWRIFEKVIALHFSQSNRLVQSFVCFNRHAWILRVRGVNTDCGRQPYHLLLATRVIDDKLRTFRHIAQISEGDRIADPIPYGGLIALQIGKRIFRWFGFQ